MSPVFNDSLARNFLNEYLGMCDEGIEIGKNFNPPQISDISNIVMCGMGGSGVCGDLLVDIAKIDVPIVVVKDYNIPKFANEKTLVFCVSYSGNTEETLNQFTQAKSKGCKIISITSGGKLKEWSEKFNIPVITIPGGRNPRDSLPLIVFPALLSLQKIGLGNFEEYFTEVKDSLRKVNLKNLDDLANKMKSSRIALYGTSDHVGSIRRMKNEFNENSKMTVIYDFFPEINHNEMNGYQRATLSKNIDVIILRDEAETQRMKDRIEITKEILQHYVNSINEIWAVGDSKFAKSISFGFMASYLTGKIAGIAGVDRSKVPFVDRLKESLQDKMNMQEDLESKL